MSFLENVGKRKSFDVIVEIIIKNERIMALLGSKCIISKTLLLKGGKTRLKTLSVSKTTSTNDMIRKTQPKGGTQLGTQIRVPKKINPNNESE